MAIDSPGPVDAKPAAGAAEAARPAGRPAPRAPDAPRPGRDVADTPDPLMPQGLAAIEAAALGDAALPDAYALTAALEGLRAAIGQDADAPAEIRETATAVIEDEIAKLGQYLRQRTR